MQKKYCFLFPGQGAQAQGMALDLYEKYDCVKALFKTARDIFDHEPLALLRDTTTEDLKRADFAQPAVALSELAAVSVLLELGVKPCMTAGHSLGEYAALVTAGVLTQADALKLVTERSRAFAYALQNSESVMSGGMAAVIGLSAETCADITNKLTAEGLSGLYAANFNSPRQTVLSGTNDALLKAETYFKEAGAKRFIRLQVGGPFHSPFMKEAAQKFEESLSAVNFNDAEIPFFSNVTGALIKSGAEIKALAAKQITSPVRWTDIEAAAVNMAPDAVLECGPGKTLCGLWKDFCGNIPCYAAGTVSEIEKLLL